MAFRMQKERRRKQVRAGELSDWDAGLLPSLPAQGGWDQTPPVKGREGRCQALVPLSCFVISWPSMSPIALKSQLGWKAEVAPGGGCGPPPSSRVVRVLCLSVYTTTQGLLCPLGQENQASAFRSHRCRDRRERAESEGNSSKGLSPVMNPAGTVEEEGHHEVRPHLPEGSWSA